MHRKHRERIEETQGRQRSSRQLHNGKVVVTYDPNEIDGPAIEKKIEDLGYRISYMRYPSITERIRSWMKRSK